MCNPSVFESLCTYPRYDLRQDIGEPRGADTEPVKTDDFFGLADTPPPKQESFFEHFVPDEKWKSRDSKSFSAKVLPKNPLDAEEASWVQSGVVLPEDGLDAEEDSWVQSGIVLPEDGLESEEVLRGGIRFSLTENIHSHRQMEDPFYRPINSFPPSFPSTACREQNFAWGVALRSYTEAVRIAAERGLSQVETPKYGEALNLLFKCDRVQKSLTTRGLLLACKICKIASQVLNIGAVLLGVSVALHSIVFSVTLAKIILVLGLGTACAGFHPLSKGLEKAASTWISSYFDERNRKTLTVLRGWCQVGNLRPIEEAINKFFIERGEAMRQDAKSSPHAKRGEWDSANLDSPLKTLYDYKRKIEAYRGISTLFDSDLAMIHSSADIDLFRNLIANESPAALLSFKDLLKAPSKSRIPALASHKSIPMTKDYSSQTGKFGS